MFDKIKNDSEIIEIYKKIEKFENDEKGWAYHNYDHVVNVTNMVEELLKMQGYDNQFIDDAKIACILHDVGALTGKDGHALRSYEFAKDYFIRNNIELSNKDLVLEAIRIHSDGFDTDNIIALALILADKLDIKKTRVALEGKNVEGMRQLLYIEDIHVKIEDNCLNVNFYVGEDIDIEELNEFYFTKKVFKAIESFSNKINLGFCVYMNGDVWNLDLN